MTRSVFILIFVSTLAATVSAAGSGHPRVYFTDKDVPALRDKATKVEWARKIVAAWHHQVDKVVERHRTDPEFAVSRLQMNWEDGKHYTRFFVRKRADGKGEESTVSRREGNAKYPTICPAWGRHWGSNTYRSVDWQENPPYLSGGFRNRGDSPFPGNIVPLEETGLGVELINEWLLGLAYKAAILYTLEGDEAYAKFAADICWVVVRGGAQQFEINPDEKKNCHGFLSWETLGDTRRYWTIPLIWDMLYGYYHQQYFKSAEFVKGREGEKWCPGHPEGAAWAAAQFEVFFKKMIENKLNRGGGLIGNWNLNEQQSAMLYALALDEDRAYEDGKGRKYYVKKLVVGPTTDTHGAYVDVLRANIDPESGLWPEAPGGYGQGSIAQLVRFGFIYWKNGYDLLSRDPLLLKASAAMPQQIFPNGFIANCGDSSYHRIWGDQLELMLAYAKAKGDEATVKRCAGLIRLLGGRVLKDDNAFFFYEDELPDAEKPELHRIDYTKIYPSLIVRNFSVGDVKDDLAFALHGVDPKMGHRHANGVTLELYGRGEVVSPDIGSGGDYWCRETHEYYRHVAGHNTVAVNGCGMDDTRGFVFERMVTNVAHRAYSWAQVAGAFNWGDAKKGRGEAEQERTVAIVRTSKKTGYYLDVMRSRVTKGEERYNDYIFHGMGRWQTPLASGGALTGGKGYDYFTVLGMTTGLPFDAVVDYGVKDVKLGVHFAAEKGDEVYQVTGPAAFRHYEGKIKDLPQPAYVVRRRGDAWERPFVAVYEPYGAGADAQVVSVEVKGTGVRVRLKDGRVDRFDVSEGALRLRRSE